MPFYTYEVDDAVDEHRYHNRQPVKLAGNGLIQKAWKRTHHECEGPWAVSNSEMLQAGGINPNQSIVIDTSPRRDTVSLFELKYVLGVTYGWTPICLILEELFSDRDVGIVPETFKRDFLDGTSNRRKVRSILYLQESWLWGGAGRFAAALLWEDVWDFFNTWQAPGHGPQI
ncbi:hypothetical protein MKK84_32670 [Methylobacterium sp. E-065]|uniref:hypothetical protein n=1 Tax=Methylobacterium sp. E-065 TaxID=2836583 RepID=UPI001FB8BC4F|nr:hypothetical protein [Methylobacterium sp. E-065]MCJ2022103.1 hypothetical protein [Methylobacterium sp. E-065]